MEYHCLVAGLPDIHWENLQNVPNLEQLLEQFRSVLSKKDRKLLDLLLMKYDNLNFLSFLRNPEAELSPLALLSTQDWKELVDLMEGEEFPKDKRLQPYLLKFYRQRFDNQGKIDSSISDEDLLTTLYFEFGTSCCNTFIAQWFEFCMNVNNVLAATICRKHGFDVKQAVIGDNEVAEALRTNNSRDFGLSGILDEAQMLLSLAEESNFYQREKMIDALKWNWLEEHAFFHPFEREKIFAYWLQCELLNRWNLLNVEKGTLIFKSLLDEMKKDVKF